MDEKVEPGVTEPSEQDEIDEQASLWLAKLGGGPLAPAEHRMLEQWLAEDTRHSMAFREAQEAWGLMGAVAKAPGALLHDAQVARVSPPRRPASRSRTLAALAASLLVLVAGAVLWTGDPMVMVAADDRTAPGERRTVHLSDGSTIELGPASAIALRFDTAERRVELLRGLAYFTAAPRKDGEQRPFVVQAASGTARALGTQFSVNRLPDSVEVVVVEHEVAVSVAAADGRPAEIVLSPGQSVRYAEAGLGRPRPVDLDQALAWRHDRLVFDRVTLGHVVDELNRYRRGRILIGNASLANRRVSGVFDTADPDTVLATIARELGVRTASAPLVTVLY